MDGGNSWERANQGLSSSTNARSVAIDPHNPQIVFAGLSPGGIFRSENGGASWQNSSAGLNPEANITSIVIDPAHPEVMYLADSFSGVFKSVNNGKTWQLFSEGLLMKSVFELAISENGAHLYAGTDGGGVYRRDLAGYPPETVSSLLFFEQTPPSNQEESEDPPPQGEENSPDEPGVETEEIPEDKSISNQFCPTSYVPFLAAMGVYQGSKRENAINKIIRKVDFSDQ